jgi:hypothetical protein
MSVLKPYIDSGKLVVRSKQMGMDKVATLRWDRLPPRPAWTTCCRPYTNAKVNAVLSPYDGLSIGILSSLRASATAPQQPFPYRHGPGCGSAFGQVHHPRRAVLDRLQGHPRAGQGHGQHGRRRAGGKQPRSTTPRPTTTA